MSTAVQSLYHVCKTIVWQSDTMYMPPASAMTLQSKGPSADLFRDWVAKSTAEALHGLHLVMTLCQQETRVLASFGICSRLTIYESNPLMTVSDDAY